MLYTHYLLSTDNTAPYRELATNISDENLISFAENHYSHFCKNDDFSKAQLAVYAAQKEMTIGCINQLYLREKDVYFYLSHIYAADLSERERILPLLPNIIATAEFESVPKQNPDLSASQIPCRSDDIITLTYPNQILKQLVQSGLNTLLKGGHLFIVSGWEDCFDLKARDLMSQIISLLPYQCRRRLNFISYADTLTAPIQGGCIVFCRPQDSLKFQKEYPENSVFYFLQQQISFPEIEILPYADFAVEHSEEIPEMLIYADRKLSGTLKNDPEFYDVLCHYRYVEKDTSLDNYAKHRAWLIPNLSQLYQLGIASRKRALKMLEDELRFEPDDSDVPFETKLSAFLYCYETEMVSKELMQKFLLHIRSCTDPIKWQLLCQQLNIPVSEESPISDSENFESKEFSDNSSLPPEEITENISENEADENVDSASSTEECERDEEAVEIFAQPEPDSAPEAEENDRKEESPMPFLSVNIPEVSDIPEPKSEVHRSAMLPQNEMEQFISGLMQTGDIVKYINAGCLHYDKPLYDDFEIERAVARYLSSAVSSCTADEELNRVAEVANQVESYRNEAMVVIAGEVRRMIQKQREHLKEKNRQQKIMEQEMKEAHFLSQFDTIFQSNDITKLNQIPLIPACIQEHISKSVIEEYALKQYREHKNPLALMFACCEYDLQGNLMACEPQKTEEFLRANIRAQELKYEWINDIAGLSNLGESEIICSAVCDYAASDKDLLDCAKLNHSALYYLLVQNGILKSGTRKYIIAGCLVATAIAAVAVAGFFLNQSGLLS